MPLSAVQTDTGSKKVNNERAAKLPSGEGLLSKIDKCAPARGGLALVYRYPSALIKKHSR
jgi:hypothetical protein